jgi:hypothetical protein
MLGCSLVVPHINPGLSARDPVPLSLARGQHYRLHPLSRSSSLEAASAAVRQHPDVTSADLGCAARLRLEDKNQNRRFRAKLISGREMSP